MYQLKERGVISVVVLLQMSTGSLGWIFSASPQYIPQYQPLSHHHHHHPSSNLGRKVLHSYAGGGLRLVKPPDLSPEPRPVVDFSKPKTQTFFKAALLPSQSPVYEFGYKVHDPKEQNFQQKSETRIGDAVKGFYSVLEPNGYVRMVKYQSDQNGFQTQVSHHHTDDNGGSYSYTMTGHGR